MRSSFVEQWAEERKGEDHVSSLTELPQESFSISHVAMVCVSTWIGPLAKTEKRQKKSKCLMDETLRKIRKTEMGDASCASRNSEVGAKPGPIGRHA